jgi:hypothetical protein
MARRISCLLKELVDGDSVAAFLVDACDDVALINFGGEKRMKLDNDLQGHRDARRVGLDSDAREKKAGQTRVIVPESEYDREELADESAQMQAENRGWGEGFSPLPVSPSDGYSRRR